MIDKIKSETEFLRHDNQFKHEYQMVKCNKSLYNFKKSQLFDIHHSGIKNYFVNPKNNYSSNPFNGSSSFYIDFEVPKLDSLFHQFVLRFSLKNNHTTANATIMPSALIIEKISCLKNSNSLSLDTDSWDVLFFNFK